MRLLHTADWHLGRTLEGRSRHQEQVDVLTEICQIAEDEQVDAVLMAGDVFDTVNPPAESETLFYETVKRLSADGERPVCIISGNHDSPARLQAARPLAAIHSVQLIGQPVPEPIQIPVRTGEVLVLSPVPYPSESRLNECLSQLNDDHVLQTAYNERVSYLFHEHAHTFRQDTVNIVMSHLFMAGGSESDSERPIQVGGAYTVTSDALPGAAQYTALGHLHRPQTISKDGGPVRYAGSPLAYSFSEAHQPKSVTMIDVVPGGSAEWQEVYVSSGKPLVKWQATGGMDDVYRWLEEGRDANAWIDLEVTVTESPSIQEIQNIRRLHQGIVHIRPVFVGNQVPMDDDTVNPEQLPLDDIFKRFYKKQTGGGEPDEALTDLFLELVHETDEDHHD